MKTLSIPAAIFLKFYIKRSGMKNAPRKFENTFTGAKKFLFLLPEDKVLIENISPLIEHLSKSGKQIVLLFHSRIGNAVQNLRKYHIEEFYDADFNLLGLPKSRLRNRLNMLEVDMLVAPNFENDLIFLGLATFIRAQCKCGLTGPYSDHVFQLQFSATRGNDRIDFLNLLQYTGRI